MLAWWKRVFQSRAREMATTASAASPPIMKNGSATTVRFTKYSARCTRESVKGLSSNVEWWTVWKRQSSGILCFR